MAFIQPPPSSLPRLTDQDMMLLLLRESDSSGSTNIIQEANDRYWHWQELRYRPMPAGFSPEKVWACLKLIRSAQKKWLPVADKRGELFSYWVPDTHLRALCEIDRWPDRILASQAGALPGREQHVISSLMEEAIASSQLEGAATTRQAAKDMLRSGRKPKDRHERMILNNWEGIQFIREHRADLLSPEMLCRIHAILTRGTLDHPEESGQFRERNDVVVAYNEETVHVPPPADDLPRRLERLCRFANVDEAEGWIHPVLKAAMIHFWVGYDHPFTDGNGRTARALMYWYALRNGYTLFEYLAISRYFLRSPAQYVRAYVCSETDGNDLTYFLAYCLRAIRLAFLDLEKHLVRKQREVSEAHRLMGKFRGLNVRQKDLILHALRHLGSSYTIRGHRNTHGVVYQTARNDLLQLAKRGLFTLEKRGREFLFFPSGRLLERLRASPGPNS